jgi:hypothetical protein
VNKRQTLACTIPDSDDEPEDFTPESYDEYLIAQVLLPQGGEASKSTAVCRKRDHDGRPIGKRHANPRLVTRLYKVEFPDGTTKAVSANLIAENLLSQVDDEGRSYSVLREIVDHRTNGHALSKDDGFTTNRKGKRHPRITTRSGELQVEWHDGSATWVPLKDLNSQTRLRLRSMPMPTRLLKSQLLLGG